MLVLRVAQAHMHRNDRGRGMNKRPSHVVIKPAQTTYYDPNLGHLLLAYLLHVPRLAKMNIDASVVKARACSMLTVVGTRVQGCGRGS